MSQDADDLRCDHCGTGLREGFLYCPGCGAALDEDAGLACPACGLSQPATVAFCSRCGAHLGSIARAERRVITVLFADLSGFTRITERLDPEAVHELAASCLEPVAECAADWGGHVDKFIGDSVMALFGVPEGHEDEPERAIRAALDMQRTVEAWDPEERYALRLEEGDRPRLGIGINTGPVVTGLLSAGSACDYTALGDVVNVASRLESACEPGQILVGEDTFRETRAVFEFDEGETLSVPGREEPVHARRVQGERGGPRAGRPGGEEVVPLVGRDEELERLHEAWSGAREGRSALLLVTGPAGIGKSRLVEELIATEGLGPERVARGRSHPHSSREPWELLSGLLADMHGIEVRADPGEAARELTRRHDADWSAEERAALAVAFGGKEPDEGGPAGPGGDGGVAAAVTKALGGDGEPRLLLMENLQWADDASLSYLTGGAASGLEGPRLLLAVARPPLPDDTALGRLFESGVPRLELGPVADREAGRLVEAVLGEEHGLPPAFVERVLRRAEGNPLFLTETLQSLVDRGVIEEEEGGWRVAADPERLRVPPAVESLLSTRIDTLPPPVKRVLQCASVAGRRFWVGLLEEELVGRPVDEDLEHLREAGLVRPVERSRLPGEEELAFDPALLREVAYDSLLRRKRSELHGRVAAWLEARADTGIPGYHRLVARHWERSNQPARAEGHREEAGRA